MAQQKKAIFISGCDTGFGKSLVLKLNALNKFIVFAGVFTKEGQEQYAGKPDIVPVSLDVTSDASVQAALATVKGELSTRNAVLSGLVNNAGILVRPAPTEWQDVSNYTRMMDVNLNGVVRLTNAFLPMLRKSQGRIVIVASIAGRVGLASNSAYCASKYAVTGYAEVLRRDLLPWKITVSVVEPGIFSQTGLYADFQKGLDTTWKNLSEDIKVDYGVAYYKHARGVLGYVLKGMSNGNPDEVPEAMLDALTSPKPQRRYRVGKDSRTFYRLLPLLPDHVVDGILTRPLGKPVLPAAVKAPVSGSDLYANDMTSSLVAGSILGLSTYGVISLGRDLISRL